MEKYNDYELIYLIREHNEVALNLMLEKYVSLIYYYMSKFHIFKKFQSEFFQEGRLAIWKAIKTYRDDCGVFYPYLSVIMKRAFIHEMTYIGKCDVPVKNLDILLNEGIIPYNNNNDEDEPDPNVYYDKGYAMLNTDNDRLVYEAMYKKGLKCREIASIYNMDIKKVYNIAAKIKKNLSLLKY